MIINDQLETFYSNCLDDLTEFPSKFKSENLHGPLLIKVGKYVDEPIKLMVVGQETYGWDQSLTIQDQLLSYESFNFGAQYKSTPFWNIIRKVECSLGVSPFAIAWSNLNRFDQNIGAPEGKVLDQITQFDYILKKEIKILNPDVCIFFTNHKYDDRLMQMYEGLVFEHIDSLPEKHFARLIHPSLPSITIRAPHPKTIRIQSWEDGFIEYIGKLA